MKVFITGGAGKIGRHTIAHLSSRGYTLKAIDRTPFEVPSAECEVCDITNTAALHDAMRDYDAVIHLAAIPLPWLAPSDEIFRTNNYGTFCVFAAAAALGIKRVICASSINALGCWFGNAFPPIHYLPVDEAHPSHTSDIYSFSKTVMEQTATYFWRRSGVPSICFRMGARMKLDPRPANSEVRQVILDLLAMPGDGGQRQIKKWLDTLFTYRQTHPTEDYVQSELLSPPDLDGMATRIVAHIAHFWTSMDIRDRAQAFEKALTADFEGSHTLFINDDHNCLNIPSQVLAELCYPGATITRELVGTESLISLDKARTLIGYKPVYSVSRYF